MDGIHIRHSAPFFVNHNDSYRIEDFELLTTLLSALKWKEKNGRIILYADAVAENYYTKCGLAEIYDDIKNLKIDEAVNPYMFWAAGKLFALKEQKAPTAVIDTDFIVWDSILFDKIGECTVIHFEDLYSDIYPPITAFSMKQNYKFPEFNYSLKACNTAFFVIKSQELLEYYTATAIDFMKNANFVSDNLRYMVFAEQRLLNLCADKLGIEVRAFSNQERLFNNGDGFFTHIWGMKQQMRENPALRKSFCRKCTDRIKKDYPEYGVLADKIVSNKI